MIINFGSLNIDNVYAVKQLVRPGETIMCTDLKVYAGGKGLNQSVAAGRAGAGVKHAGIIGGEGKFLLDILKDSNVDTSLVQTVNAKNGHAFIQVEQSGQNSIILYPGTNHMLDAVFAQQVADTLKDNDIVLLQNETSAISDMIALASDKRCRIALNPAPMDESILKLPLDKVDIFILNEIEGNGLTGKDEPEDILEEMANQFPEAKTLLTVGKKGSLFACGKSRYRFGIFHSGGTVDTTGAGDTFTGYYLAGISMGMNDIEAINRATVAAGICVTHKGAAPSIPYMMEVEAVMGSLCEPQKLLR